MTGLLDAAVLQAHYEALPLASYAADEMVISTGTITGKLFVLKTGKVEVTRNAVVIGIFDEPGLVFGELAVLLDEPHTADVRAVEPSTFHVGDAAELLRNEPLATLHVAIILAHRLHAANIALVDLQHQLADGKPGSVLGPTLDRLENALRADIDPDVARPTMRLFGCSPTE